MILIRPGIVVFLCSQALVVRLHSCVASASRVSPSFPPHVGNSCSSFLPLSPRPRRGHHRHQINPAHAARQRCPSHSSSNPGDWSSLSILTAGLGRGRVVRASRACLRLSFRAVFNSGMNVPSRSTQAAAVIDTPGVNTSAMFSAAGGQAVSLFYARHHLCSR